MVVLRLKRIAAIAVAVLATIVIGSAPALAKALPDSTLTPGATREAVGQESIASTICTPGYSRSVRHVSASLKRSAFAAYKIKKVDRSGFVIDHLVPLELGGANRRRNLWPEPVKASRKKDAVENRLHELVCSGAVGLRVAQAAIATDWRTAVAAIPTTTTTSTTTTTTAPPPTTQAPAPITQAAPPPPAPLNCPNGTYTNVDGIEVCRPFESPGQPAGATARCNDGTYSFSQHRRGTCSSHGGVAEFLVDLPA